MCTDRASGLSIVPHRHGYSLINERMPPAVSAEHCATKMSRKDSSNPSAAWVDLYVPGLLRGIYGTKKWMAEIGRSGRSVKTGAKKRAARVNGLKGQAATAEGLRRAISDRDSMNHHICKSGECVGHPANLRISLNVTGERIEGQIRSTLTRNTNGRKSSNLLTYSSCPERRCPVPSPVRGSSQPLFGQLAQPRLQQNVAPVQSST